MDTVSENRKGSLWNRLSNVGVGHDSGVLESRSNRLSNQVNMTLILTLTLLNGITLIDLFTRDQIYNLYTSRLLILELILLANFYFASRRNFALVKISLTFFPTFTLIIIPVWWGFIQTSSFFYYHIIVIGLSLVPVTILDPKNERLLYSLGIIYFFLILLFLDDFMINFSESERQVKYLISFFQLYYKVIPLSIFCVLQLAFLYLKRMNSEFSEALTESNKALTLKVEELGRMQDQIVQNEKMVSLGTMVAGVAHEINNPLNFVRGGQQIIQKELQVAKQSLPEFNEGMELIDDGVNRITTILERMVSFRYSEALVKEKLNIIELIDDGLLMLASKVPPNLEIKKEYGFGKPFWGYKEKLTQLITNLLDNALFEASKGQSDPKLSIKLSQESGKVLLTIFNSGEAIPEVNLHKIFDPFFTTKDPGIGTGLGLAICHMHASAHDGFIEAKNEHGGVLFRVSLPIN